MKKNKHTSNAQINITTLFGYGLFSLAVLAVIVSTIIPFGTLLLNPTVKHLNVIILMIMLVASAILPAFVSYILGDRATHVKNKLMHHYNGILFGISAYWLWQLFSFFGINTLSSIRASLPLYLSSVVHALPILATLVIMTFLAISYARNQKNKTSVLQHPPYQFVLVGTVTAFIIYIAFNQNYEMNSMLWHSAISLMMPIVLTLISYRIIAKNQSSHLAGITSAVIAMSMASIPMSLSGVLISYLNIPFTIMIWLTQLLGIIVWATYLWLVTRKR